MPRTKTSKRVGIGPTTYSTSGTTSLPVEEGKDGSADDSKSPSDFDNFIPWVCSQWGVTENVFVIRLPLEERTPAKKSQLRINQAKARTSVTDDLDETAVSNLSLKKLKSKLGGNQVQVHDDSKDADRSDACLKSIIKLLDINCVVIRAYYDSKDYLAEISFLRCPVNIPRKLILAISLCLPYHPELTRINIRRGGLTHLVLHEISKLLPQSNIKFMCLDDSVVPQGNYHELLQRTSQLSYLSLNRCRINDDACKNIAKSLALGNPAASTLHILELASNDISDKGAEYLGNMLRSNRCLLHLNLAGNNITDVGAAYILTSLMRFRLNKDEVLERKRRRLRYLENKQAVYKRCLEDLLLRKNTFSSRGSTRSSARVSAQISTRMSGKMQNRNSASFKLVKFKKPKKTSNVPPPLRESTQNAQNVQNAQTNSVDLSYAETLTKGIVGEFIDPFSPKNVDMESFCYFCKGNFILCSLNLAYNNLHYTSLRKVAEIVTYQHQTLKAPPATGLIRIVLDGNFLPESCDEFDRIEFYLNSSSLKVSSVSTARHSFISSKKDLRKSKLGLKQHKSRFNVP